MHAGGDRERWERDACSSLVSLSLFDRQKRRKVSQAERTTLVLRACARAEGGGMFCDPPWTWTWAEPRFPNAHSAHRPGAQYVLCTAFHDGQHPSLGACIFSQSFWHIVFSISTIEPSTSVASSQRRHASLAHIASSLLRFRECLCLAHPFAPAIRHSNTRESISGNVVAFPGF